MKINKRIHNFDLITVNLHLYALNMRVTTVSSDLPKILRYHTIIIYSIMNFPNAPKLIPIPSSNYLRQCLVPYRKNSVSVQE